MKKQWLILALIFFVGCENNNRSLIEEQTIKSVVKAVGHREQGRLLMPIVGDLLWVIQLEDSTVFAWEANGWTPPPYWRTWVGDTVIYTKSVYKNLQFNRLETDTELEEIIKSKQHEEN